MTRATLLRTAALGVAAVVLTGCASFSPDGGFGSVQSLTRERIGQDTRWLKSGADNASVAAAIAPLLAKPLSVDDAVTVALMNNKALQAAYGELGISEANLVQAGRVRNPVFSFGRLKRGSEIDIERTLMLPVMSLLTMPIATRIERRAFEQAQLRAAGEALSVADDTRRTYFSAVAAQESVRYMDQVKLAAEAAAELASRMAAAGNFSKLDHAREQAFYADVVVQLARARQSSTEQRERLTRLMGLSSADTVQLPNRLPELPSAPQEAQALEAGAMQNRLDVIMARRELSGLATSLGLTKATRFINLLDVGYLHNSIGHSPGRETGYEIELQIPLFDWGSARVARAEAMYMQAVQRAAETAINARSEVRSAYSAYRTTYDIARHYRDEIIPLKKRISDEQLLRYNGMLISVFELLADSRSQVLSVNAAIEAQRDFWMAHSALQMAQTGRSSAPLGSGKAAPAIAEPAGH